MAPIAEKSAKGRTADPPSAPDVTTALSVRLAEKERKLLEDAAALKGWTPTSLLRTAALERAVHILNTSRPTKLSFATLAIELGGVLCGERFYSPDPAHGEDPRNLEYGDSISTEPFPLSVAGIHAFREAVRLGGLEFINQILADCERRVPSQASTLPDPIDPAKIV